MPKRVIEEAERQKIIKLRNTGTGWKEIERRTGVARRTAQRVYREWQATQFAENQWEARRQVAAQQFERHMRELIVLAERLVTELELPDASDLRSGDGIVDSVLGRDLRDLGSGESGQLSDFDARRIRRRNDLLFQSLKDHSGGKVEWRAFDRWLGARNAWASYRGKLSEAAEKVLKNVIHDESGGEWQKLIGDADLSPIVEGIVRSALSTLAEPELSVEKYVTVQRSGEEQVLSLGCGRDAVELKFRDAAVSEVVAHCCHRALDTLVRGHESTLLETMGRERDTMKRSRDELEDKLHELRLEPLILLTRCQFCPA